MLQYVLRFISLIVRLGALWYYAHVHLASGFADIGE